MSFEVLFAPPAPLPVRHAARPRTCIASPRMSKEGDGPPTSAPPAAKPPAPSASAPKYSQQTRLREETEAPFRKVRMFVLAGSAASAGVGAFIAGARVLAGLAGVSGVQPLAETVRAPLFDAPTRQSIRAWNSL